MARNTQRKSSSKTTPACSFRIRCAPEEHAVYSYAESTSRSCGAPGERFANYKHTGSCGAPGESFANYKHSGSCGAPGESFANYKHSGSCGAPGESFANYKHSGSFGAQTGSGLKHARDHALQIVGLGHPE